MSPRGGRVEGLVALVTGAARGQGRNHAIRLAEQGADLILLDICEDLTTLPYSLASEAELDDTAEQVRRCGRRVVVGKVDVRDGGALASFADEAVSQLGRLDIVSVNAGVLSYGRVIDLSFEQWSEQIDVNLTGAFNTAKAAVPHIVQRGCGGSVVFTASINGLRAAPNIGHYGASKFGVVGLAKTLAVELGPHNIRVNALCPGSVNTIMMHNDGTLRAFFPDVANPTTADLVAPGSPARTMHVFDIPYVELDDVTNALLYLVSDDGRYVTGTTLVVDLGRMVKE